mgnify:CR=1 FL=1
MTSTDNGKCNGFFGSNLLSMIEAGEGVVASNVSIGLLARDYHSGVNEVH